MDTEKLIQAAFEGRNKAYAPYSNFKVGACVQLKDGTMIEGCNIENAAYGSTMCAERNAVYQAYCRGYRKDDIVALAIVGDCEPLISPCGACRQVLSELLHPTTPIVLASKTTYEMTNMEELMPKMFTSESL